MVLRGFPELLPRQGEACRTLCPAQALGSMVPPCILSLPCLQVHREHEGEWARTPCLGFMSVPEAGPTWARERKPRRGLPPDPASHLHSSLYTGVLLALSELVNYCFPINIV